MAKFPETRISLIVRLAEQEDVEAWQEFAEIYAPSLYGLALRNGLQPVDAEDVTQEVLFGVARAIHRFDVDRERAAFRTWLTRIARNLIADHFRRCSRPAEPREGLDDVDYPADQTTPDVAFQEQFEQEYRATLFRHASARIRERIGESVWAAFHRTAIQGEQAKVVAGDLQMTLGHLYVVRSRVLKMLRFEVQRLEKLYGDGLGAWADHAEAPTGEYERNEVPHESGVASPMEEDGGEGNE
ncbi:MAG: sigma-70 family RNA polymerase sigma factor [Planctomycetota bacterium]